MEVKNAVIIKYILQIPTLRDDHKRVSLGQGQLNEFTFVFKILSQRVCSTYSYSNKRVFVSQMSQKWADVSEM